MKIILALFFCGSSVAAQAQITKLDKLKGTWLITYLDTSKNGLIRRDSIATTLDWSAVGNSLEGKQRIKIAGEISYSAIRYTFNERTREFSYSENSGPSSSLEIFGNTWIYPAGNFRTLNIFNHSAKEIIYKVQKLKNGTWITIKEGKEVKIRN